MTSPGTRVSHEAAVLIVEDGPLVRAFAADILMDAGYRVFEACEAADALTILEGRDDIGTVFTDIEMSGMTGLALAGVITEGWPEIAILVTSGRIQPDPGRSEEHTSELQSLMRISYAVFCLKKKKN